MITVINLLSQAFILLPCLCLYLGGKTKTDVKGLETDVRWRTDEGDSFLVEHSTGQEVEVVLHRVHNHCVSCIVAPLQTWHTIRCFSESVFYHDLAPHNPPSMTTTTLSQHYVRPLCRVFEAFKAPLFLISQHANMEVTAGQQLAAGEPPTRHQIHWVPLSLCRGRWLHSKHILRAVQARGSSHKHTR